jgi:hypothetical protein
MTVPDIAEWTDYFLHSRRATPTRWPSLPHATAGRQTAREGRSGAALID